MLLSPVLFGLACLSASGVAKKSLEKVAAGYFTGWHATEGFPISSINWSKYNTMIYSFAETTNDVHQLTLNGSEPELLPAFVLAAHANNVEAHISIGGWSGSRFFSTALATAHNRTAFVKTVVSFVQEYNLDGINIDWEYPNNQGLGCNTINKHDTRNLLSFLKDLRKDPVGASITVSAATSINPFMNALGSPSADVSDFANYLDYIVAMNYDIWGSWSSAVGPDSPLNDTCASPDNQQGSAVYAVQAWTDAGFPRSQIVLGMASYGHSFSVTPTDAYVNGTDTLELYAAFNASAHPVGGGWDDEPAVDACGVFEPQGGVINFFELIDQGYLDSEGNPIDGVPYIYDECSQTPFIYNTTTEVMISYDNAEAFEAKGQFIVDNQLLGFGIWEVGGDSNDILVDAVRSAVFADDC